MTRLFKSYSLIIFFNTLNYFVIRTFSHFFRGTFTSDKSYESYILLPGRLRVLEDSVLDVEAGKSFRAEILLRPADEVPDGRGLARRDVDGQPEVDHFQTARHEEEVCRLDVGVNDAVLVDRLHDLGQVALIRPRWL